jgi:hypothetical protein
MGQLPKNAAKIGESSRRGDSLRGRDAKNCRDGMTANSDEAHTTLAAHRQWDWLRRRVRPLWRRSSRIMQRLTAVAWVRRSLWAVGITIAVLLVAFAALMWRLSRGPIGIDIATPWLASAIAQNFGGAHSITIGGTQIERDEHGHTAIRILDIVVRDADGAVVASAPKADIGLSGTSLLFGKLRAQSFNLVGAELAVRIETDGRVTVFAGANTRPIAVAAPPAGAKAAAVEAVGDTLPGVDDIAAVLAWIDGLGTTGLDGHDLGEIGLKSGSLSVDDQRNGKRWTFSHINLSLSRPSLGGVIFRVDSDDPERPWQLSAALRPFNNGVRAVGLEARQVSLSDILLALRVGGGTLESNLPLSASVRAEFTTDGLLRVARGQILASSGFVQDSRDAGSRIDIDHADVRFNWDGAQRTLAAPFQVQANGNQFTLLLRAQPSEEAGVWSLALDRGDPVIDPVILAARSNNDGAFALNRAVLRGSLDTLRHRVQIEHGDVGRTDTRPGYNIGVALNGAFDWDGPEPRLAFGVAANRMPFSLMKRLWPAFVCPNIRRWVDERMSDGTVERVLIAGNAPIKVLTDTSTAFPEEALSIEIETNGMTLQPIAKLPPIRDADLAVRVNGRAAHVTLGRGTIDVAAGRRLNIANGSFDIPDTHQKPSPATSRFRIDGSVGAAAALLALEPLRGTSAAVLDPAKSRGTVAAQVTVNLDLARDDVRNVTYSVTADLSNFVGDGLLMGQKVEAQSLHAWANSKELQVKGDARVNGTLASLEFHQTAGDPLADLNLRTVLDDAARRRLGISFGSSVVGHIPVVLVGRIGPDDSKNQLSVDADFTSARIDQLLPGWTKPAGKAARVTFSLVKTPKSTRFDNMTVESPGTLVKGAVELDSSGDLLSANFPVYALSGGDQISLRADRTSDGALSVQMRGDVYDGRQFVKTALASEPASGKQKQPDLDLDIKVGTVAGSNGETLRGLDLKFSRRAGRIKVFMMKAKIGRDAPLLGELRVRARDNHAVLYLETEDAGALFRFTDFYARMYGGQMWLAMDPPTRDNAAQVGVLNVQNFMVRDEPAFNRVLSGAPEKARAAVDFTEMRADFTRLPGRMMIRDGVVRGPTIGATIDGQVDLIRDDLRLHGTFLPLYGLNNMFGKIPIVGLFLGGGSNEGLVGINYEVSGSPAAPRVSFNPISAVAPGLLRKFVPGPGGFDRSADFQ